MASAREQISGLAAEALEAFRAGLNQQIPGPEELADLEWAFRQELAGQYLRATGRDSEAVRQAMAEAAYVIRGYGLAHMLDAATLADAAVNRAIDRGLEIGFAALSNLLLRAATGGIA